MSVRVRMREYCIRGESVRMYVRTHVSLIPAGVCTHHTVPRVHVKEKGQRGKEKRMRSLQLV